MHLKLPFALMAPIINREQFALFKMYVCIYLWLFKKFIGIGLIYNVVLLSAVCKATQLYIYTHHSFSDSFLI